jgi:hypothetical protein
VANTQFSEGSNSCTSLAMTPTTLWCLSNVSAVEKIPVFFNQRNLHSRIVPLIWLRLLNELSMDKSTCHFEHTNSPVQKKIIFGFHTCKLTLVFTPARINICAKVWKICSWQHCKSLCFCDWLIVTLWMWLSFHGCATFCGWGVHSVIVIMTDVPFFVFVFIIVVCMPLQCNAIALCHMPLHCMTHAIMMLTPSLTPAPAPAPPSWSWWMWSLCVCVCVQWVWGSLTASEPPNIHWHCLLVSSYLGPLQFH